MGFRNKLVSILTAGLLTVSGTAGVAAITATPALAAPCTTSNVNGNCGPYQDPTVFRTPNATDLVTQNDFSSIPQTLTATDSTTWTVTANTSGQQDQTSVKSYPATQVTYTTTAGKPEPLSTFGLGKAGATFISNYTNTEPSGPNQDYEYAVDDWLNNPANNSWANDTELMIWTDTHGQRPFGNDTGNVYTDAAGVQWEIWTGGGASAVSPVSVISFVRKVNSVSGSLDRLGFYDYMRTHGLINSSISTLGLDQTNYGLEICSTGGSAKTYGVTNYSQVVGQGQPQNQAPVVSTDPASAVTDTSATLNGSVNPEGQATSFQFDYGTTNAYGTTVGSGSAGSGSNPVNESANLTGLLPSTTYHYRIEATNATGTTFGSDQTFTTAATGGGGGGTSVAFDSQAGAKKVGTSLNWSQTMGAGSNRAVLVEATVGTGNDNGCIQTVKLNGVTMKKLAVIHTNNQHAGFMDVWSATAPPAGVNNFAMTTTGCTAPTLTAVSESFTGVDQVNPSSAVATAVGSGATASGSIATASANDMVAAFAAAGNTLQAPGAPAQHSLLENQNGSTGAGNSAGATAPGTGGTVSVAWPMASDWWATGLVGLHHAA